ncbi:MAG: DUF11 domain-containing protein, partial [Methanothermobacter sp.]
PDNSANATVTVDPAADVAVTKMVSNSTPNFGELVTFYVTVTNNGPDNATGVTVTDSLPVGLVYVSHVVSRGSFNPLTGVWLVGDLLPGSSATLNFTVLVNRTGDVVNRVLAVGEEFDPYPENNTAEVTVRVPAAAYLVIDKVVNATMVNFTDTVRFTVSVRNDGPDTAAGVVVTDLLPAGLVYLSHSVSQGTYDSVTGAWIVGSLVKDAVATLEVVAGVAVSNTTLVNVADVVADTYNPNPDKSANATVTVNPRAELIINKTVDRRAVRVGQNVRFTITVTNNGPDTALNTMVTDRLPDAMRYISSNATRGSYNPATGVWMVGDLPAGSSAVLDMVVQLIRRGTFVNVATVSSGSSGGNNTTDVEIDVEPSPGPGPSPGPSPRPQPGPGTVPMKPTGIPVIPLLVGVIIIVTSIVLSGKK